jgi:tetratricopeptide (TPR) repeat protein
MNDTVAEINSLSLLSEIYQQRDSLDKAFELISSAENLLHKMYLSKESQEQADILQYHGAIMMGEGRLDFAISLLKKSLQIRERIKVDSDTLSGYACNKLGTCYWYKQMHDSSLYFYRKALDASVSKTDPENHESASYNQNVGFAYLNQGKYEEAEKYLLTSLKLKKKLLDENDLRLARIYLNLGYFYFRVSLTNKALSYYREAEKVYMNNPANINDELARLYWNIGNYYSILGDFKKSLIYLNKALGIYNENTEKNLQNLVRLYSDIGHSYFVGGNYLDAIHYYKLAKSTSNINSLIRIYRIWLAHIKIFLTLKPVKNIISKPSNWQIQRICQIMRTKC